MSGRGLDDIHTRHRTEVLTHTKNIRGLKMNKVNETLDYIITQ